jgi:histidyl-tRNA synthetase
LGEGRKDESGDFTEGAGLDADQRRHVLSFIEAGQVEDALTGAARNTEVLKRLTQATLGDTEAGKLAVADLETITSVLDALGQVRELDARHLRRPRSGLLHRPGV